MGLERVFEANWTLQKLRSEPLGILFDDFCEWLLDQGFTWHGVRKHLGKVSHLNVWLAERNWRWSGALSRREVEAFFEAYPHRCRNRGSLENHLKRVRHSVSRFTEFLRQKGTFDPLTPSPVYQSLLEAYLAWMRDHQYTAESTLKPRRRWVQRFLQWLGTQATVEGTAHLTADDVETFFIAHGRDMGHASRGAIQAALRTFLRFCWHEGHIRHRLDRAVPTLRTYKLARVPRGLDEDHAQAMLQSVDRNTAVGRRDYAILQLLHTYGVRGGQVRALRLGDIRWAKDEILFRATKNGKDSLLPLTQEVGKGILDYLRNARPQCRFSEVFLTCRAPCRPLRDLYQIVLRRMLAAGIDTPCGGSHAFRHAFASRMVADGHPFKAVADVLGHRCLSTTFIYTKIDFNALKRVALPWPEEVCS